MKRKFFFPLAIKAFIFFMLLISVILLVASSYVHKESRGAIDSMVDQQFNQAMRMAENHFDLLRQMNKTLINNLSEEHELIKYMLTENKEKLRILIADKRHDIQCDQIILLDNNANVITQSGSIPFDGSTLRNLDIVDKTLDQKKQFSTVVRQYDAFVMYVSAPMKINNEQSGMLLMGFAINNKMLQNIKKDTVLEFAIVGDRAIAATSFEVDGELMRSLPMPYTDYLWLLKYPGEYYEAKIENKYYYITARVLKNLDKVSYASLLMAYPSNEIKKHEEDLKNAIFISISFALIFSILMIFIFARKFRRILNMMVIQTQQIRNGDYDHRLSLKTNDEFEYLAQNFNAMTDSLQKQNQTIVEYTNSLEEKVKERTKELEELSMRDVLTGQYNRLKFNQELEKALYNTKRYDGIYSFVICDIDNFKSINDTYGHVVGDYALVTLSNIFSEHIRKTDIFARWGGEEFVILLSSADALQAEQFANGLREALAEHIFDEFEKLTCSFGVTQILESDTIECLVDRADKGLYFSKENGKDRVTIV